MNDFNLYGKSNDQIDSLVRTVYLFTSDVGMEFGVKKCGTIVLKRGKMGIGSSYGKGDEEKDYERVL